MILYFKRLMLPILKTLSQLSIFAAVVRRIPTTRKNTKKNLSFVPSNQSSDHELGGVSISFQAKVDPKEPSKLSVSFGETRIEVPKNFSHDGKWHNFIFSDDGGSNPAVFYLDGQIKGYRCVKCGNLMEEMTSHDNSAVCEIQQVLNS